MSALIAAEHSEKVFSLGRVDAPTFSRRVALINLGLVEYETGNPEAGYRCFHPVTGDNRTPEKLDFPCAVMKIARITGDTRSLEELARQLDPVLTGPSKHPHNWWETARHVARSMVAVLLGDRETAASEIYYFAQCQSCYSPLGLAGRSFDAVLGLLESMEGEFDAAVGHLQDGVHFCRKSGFRPELGWTCLGLAETLLKRGGAGDRAAASQVLDDGRGIARHLGMKPLLEKIEDCRKRITRTPEWRIFNSGSTYFHAGVCDSSELPSHVLT